MVYLFKIKKLILVEKLIYKKIAINSKKKSNLRYKDLPQHLRTRELEQYYKRVSIEKNYKEFSNKDRVYLINLSWE